MEYISTKEVLESLSWVLFTRQWEPDRLIKFGSFPTQVYCFTWPQGIHHDTSSVGLCHVPPSESKQWFLWLKNFPLTRCMAMVTKEPLDQGTEYKEKHHKHVRSPSGICNSLTPKANLRVLKIQPTRACTLQYHFRCSLKEDNWWKNLPEAKPKATDDNEQGNSLAEPGSNGETHFIAGAESLSGYYIIAVVQWLLFPSLSFLFWKSIYMILFLICCCCSVAKLCLTLCDPMDCSTPGFPVLHHLPEFAHTHVHWVGDAIQPSHPLSSPSLPALNLSLQLGLSQWVGSLHQVAKVLKLQHQSYQGIFRVDLV